MQRRRQVFQIPRIAYFLTFLAVAMTVPPVQAKRVPESSFGAPLKVSPAPLRELEGLGPVRFEAGVHREFGAASGLLRRYYRRIPSRPSKASGTPRQIAADFLSDHATLLGLESARGRIELDLQSEKPSPSGVHLRWQQTVDRVPVYRSEIVVKVSRGGEVSSVQNNLRPHLPSSLGRPGLDAEQAVQRGLQSIVPRGRAIGEFTAELYVVDFETGPRLTYLVSIPVEEPMGDWLVFVDATSGAVLGIEDRMLYVNGSGRVFDPDPESKMGDPNLPDNNDADSGIPFPDAYDIRPLLDITQVGANYELSGPYARILDFESPVVVPVTTTDPDSFRFTRSPDSFEDVNVYFHLDQNQRYIQSLGFTNVNNRVQEADSHGLNGADNSHYVISTRQLAFGDGGVDDAEDADVIIHEYGHSIQHDIVTNWGGGQEGAMGEGFGDYWAGTYSYSLFPSYQPDFVFNWDGHNEFWPGRVLVDSTKHYPEDCCGQVHSSGTLWCSGIYSAMLQIGRTTMDQLVIDHHFALGSTATMADAASQIIQSDVDLNGGANVQMLVQVFDFWGFVDASTFLPIISHVPLTDTEDTVGPYPVVATITSAQPLDPASLQVVWGIAALTDTLPMAPTATPDEYAASIPGPLAGVDVRYYISAADSAGGVATDPAGAPAAFHQFHVGADTLAPAITHAPIGDFPRLRWPAQVQAQITDNLGVDDASVRVDWLLNFVAQTSFSLVRVGASDVFEGTFPSDTTMVAIGDVVDYTIVARDLATTPNESSSGPHSFKLIDALGLVLVLDDDEVARQATRKRIPVQGEKGEFRWLDGTVRDPLEVGKAAQDMAQVLSDLGYIASVELAATSDPGTWPTYDFIVSSSGGNEGPVADAAYRSAIESYVAAGGKLLVEGGEVVYDAASSPGYPTFAANVLHSTDWDRDDAGDLNLLAGQESHPIATIPNALPATLTINYTGFGSEDSYKPNAPAYIVYGVSADPGNGGILVFDDNPSPQSAQVVVFGFDFKDLADLATRTALLENTAAYLTAAEGAPDGSISGTVTLGGETDHSGVAITVSPGGASALSGPDGTYVVSGLYAQTYSVTASKAGFTEATQSDVTVAQSSETGGVDFVLYPVPEVSRCVTPNLGIPDNDPVGITSDIVIPDSFAVEEVEVSVNITHTWRGDLIVEVSHGATTVRLHDRSGDSTDNIIGTYPTTLTADGPGALADFNGQPSNGTWTLAVSDNSSLDSGTLVDWCVTIRGPADSTVTDVSPGEDLPTVTSLFPSRPNPAPGGVTWIRFGLSSAQRVDLQVFDVRGRLVRTLHDGGLPAGHHQLRWDGLDERGRAVAAGVYLYRLRTSASLVTRKLVVVRE